MYFILNTKKNFSEACDMLEKNIPEMGFNLQHCHNIGDTLRSKGQNFSEECRVYEMCNAKYAALVLDIDLRMNMALPCRMSVFTDQGETKIGMIKPSMILSGLSSDPRLQSVAKEVEDKMIAILEACV